MGGVAASGGYYISSASNYIIADEYTITGSIGVIMMIPDGEGLGRKIGVRNQNISFGKYAGAFDLFSKPDPEFLNSLQRNSTAVYTEFKARVADNRKYTDAEIEAIAQGQIWSAADAKTNRLIDEIGGLNSAIAKAASLAKIKDYQTVNFPEPISLWDAIRKSGSWSRALSSMKKINILTPAQIQEYIDHSIITNEWLYMMPFKMD
jgi:protease-4